MVGGAGRRLQEPGRGSWWTMASPRPALVLLLACFLAATRSASAFVTAPPPEGGIDLIAGGKPHPVLPKAGVALTVAEQGDIGTVWRFAITGTPGNSWSVQLGAAVTGPVKEGDRCLLTFLARCVASPTGRASGSANVEIREAPGYFKVGRSEFIVGKTWTPVNVPFAAAKTIPDGKGGVAIHLGGEPQTVEIARLQLLNYGPDYDLARLPHPVLSYEGREPDAPWRREALARIEKLRKGALKLEIVDAAGRPVPGAEVRAVLRRHAFGFGSAVTAKMLCDTSPDGERYRAVVDECFSRVVLENDLKPFAWDNYQHAKQEGNFRKAWLDQSLAWLAGRHIPVRGHYLCWGPFEPWSEKLRNDPQAIREQALDRMREKVPVVGDRVCEWDALNHPVGWEKGICVDSVLGASFYNEVFREARKLTKLPLWINEDQVFRAGRQQEEYFAVIKRLLDEGVKIDGIGNQAHFHSSYLPSPEDMRKNSDRFAALVPALQLTEFDLNTDGDEQLAADFTRDLLITCFSHPAYTGFVMWGFWEGAHWKPETALWRKDWSEKPNAKVWREWVCGKWKTEVTVASDARGRADVAGFFGRYEVTVAKDGKRLRQELELLNGPDTLARLVLE
jgi:endo-1,4-beta-xylanase